MQDLLDEFRGLVAALEEAGVDFAVCGGLAVAVHARPRATLDIDLLLPRDQLEGARDVALRLGYRDSMEMQGLSKPDPETGDLLSLDLLLVTPGLTSIWQSRERVAWEYGSLPVVSRSGLVQMKRLRGSGLDLDDIRALEGHDEEC